MLPFDELTAVQGQIARGASLENPEHRLGEGYRLVRSEYVAPGRGPQALQRGGSRHHRPGGRQSLQHLVLYAPCEAQRGHDHGGLRKVWPYLRDGAGDLDVRQPPKGANRGRGSGADDPEDHPRGAPPDERKHLLRKPPRAFHIGAIVHASAHDDEPPLGGAGGGERLQIDAIGHRIELGRPLRLQASHDLPFGVAHQQRRIGSRQQGGFEGEELARLPPEQPREREGGRRGIGGPLGCVRVHEVDEQRQPLGQPVEEALAEGGGVEDDEVWTHLLQGVVDPARQVGVMEAGDAERTAREQGDPHVERAPERSQPGTGHLRAPQGRRIEPGTVGAVIDRRP